jgi:outer membrane lipoprotein LolB
VSATNSLRVLAAATLAILAACAELPFLQPATGLKFQLSGRIAVRYDNQGSSGNIAWRHRAAGDEMLITSPLGQGVARIERENGLVTVTGSDQRVYRAHDAESLTEQVLGFRVPLAGLSDWVQAKAAPGPAHETRDADGRLSELEQDGWRIYYLAYGDVGGLPARMRLVYPGLELRLAIDNWQVRP